MPNWLKTANKLFKPVTNKKHSDNSTGQLEMYVVQGQTFARPTKPIRSITLLDQEKLQHQNQHFSEIGTKLKLLIEKPEPFSQNRQIQSATQKRPVALQLNSQRQLNGLKTVNDDAYQAWDVDTPNINGKDFNFQPKFKFISTKVDQKMWQTSTQRLFSGSQGRNKVDEM